MERSEVNFRNLLTKFVSLKTAEADRTSMLFAVIKSGNPHFLRRILEAGADVNVTDDSRFTTLQQAVMHGHDKCAELLVKKGADVNAVHRGMGKGAEANSPDKTTRDVFAMLQIPLTMRERNNKIGIDPLLKSGANVNKTSNMFTALHMAVVNNHTKCVDLLIKLGADVKAVDIHNNSVLHMAVYSGSYQNIVLIIKAGACVNMTNDHSSTVLVKYVVENMNPDMKIIELLIAAGETVQITRYFGNDCISGTTVSLTSRNIVLPDYLLRTRTPLESGLKHACRQVIRKHLLDLSRVNLFCRAPRLGLPPIITEYLLYGVSLG